MDKNEIRIGILGGVDAGKSTLISVLKHNILDDGRGTARLKIMKHQHEKESGRTSDIGFNFIETENKIVILNDLAGHEKYLKTTIHGLCNSNLDLTCIIIGANMGINKMTREHLGLTISLKIPYIVIITKIDMCPENILVNTIKDLDRISKSSYVGNKKMIILDEDYLKSNLTIDYENIFPVLLLSNKNGKNIDLLRYYLYNKVNKREIYNSSENKNENTTLFLIESIYTVIGLNTVVCGTLIRGTINTNQKLLIGPFGKKFMEITVKSIMNSVDVLIPSLKENNFGCICIKGTRKNPIKKDIIRKNMILTNIGKCYTKFSASILVLHHPTTIKINYQPVIQCRNISQSAKITYIDKEYIRTGDRAIIHLEFLCHPEYIEKDLLFICREGRSKCVGKILEPLED
jgi:small GTP-binding protein